MSIVALALESPLEQSISSVRINHGPKSQPVKAREEADDLASWSSGFLSYGQSVDCGSEALSLHRIPQFSLCRPIQHLQNDIEPLTRIWGWDLCTSQRYSQLESR